MPHSIVNLRCLAVVVLTLPGAACRGAEEPVTAAEIDRLVRQLGDDDFDKREAASKALTAIGKPALRAVLRARTHPDVEVRRRAEQIFEALAAKLPDVVQKAAEICRFSCDNVHVYNTNFSTDSRFYVAGGDNCTLRIYETKSASQVQELVGHTGYSQCAVFTPDGKQVLSASLDKTLRLWDVKTGKEVRRFEGHTDGVGSVDITRDGKWAVSGSADKTLRLWEVATGKEMRTFEGHTAGCMGIFTPDGKKILSSGNDNTMRFWDVANGKELRRFEGHTSHLYGAFLLPDGKRALSYSADQTARLWDLETGKELSRLNLGPSLSDIRGLALAPDGKHILVGEDSQRVARLIELASGREVHRFPMGTPLRGVSFSPDGRTAVSGSWRGWIYQWRMPGVFDLE
jgi:WD40 repeat protein